MRTQSIALLVFGIMAVALASPLPDHHHKHVVIHVPYKVHTIHHHHTKKVHIPVHHVEKVPVPVPVHHVEKVPVPYPVVEKVPVPYPVVEKVPVPIVQKVPVPIHVPIHEEKLHGGWL
ncbi:uncharacterized protein [Anoplolepis gracilipes]|uniref:uncharacterized protein n=1 Tax=Anoplolepis gracilipes TaxID=354296 RepID=UPI003B9F0966